MYPQKNECLNLGHSFFNCFNIFYIHRTSQDRKQLKVSHLFWFLWSSAVFYLFVFIANATNYTQISLDQACLRGLSEGWKKEGVEAN